MATTFVGDNPLPAIGVALPLWPDRPPEELLEVGRATIELGLPELWLGEMATFDSVALAAALAARAGDRTRLTVGPLPVGLRDPVALALGLATVSSLAAEPVDIALGASTRVVVEDWHGQPFDHVIERTSETITALRQILGGGRSDFRGRHVRSRGFRLWADCSKTRITLAGFGPRMLELGARMCDRVVLNMVTPEIVRQVRAQIDEVSASAGRPSPSLAVWMMASIDTDTASLRQIARNVAIYLRQPSYRPLFVEAGFGRFVHLAASVPTSELIDAIPLELIELVAAVGSIDRVLEASRAHGDAGADVVCLVPATAGDPAASRLLAALAADRPVGAPS